MTAIDILLQENIVFNVSLPGRKGNLVRRDVTGPIAIIGDLHGEKDSFTAVTDAVLSLAGSYKDRISWFFLGDYVDRGPDSIGVLKSVLSLALDNPERVVLLRGNHEDRRMNLFYGFDGELCLRKMEWLVPLIERWYDSLPLISVIGPVAMVHGGPPFPVPISENLLSKIRFPEPQAMQILWSDPDDVFYENRGGGTRAFSGKECERFLNLLGCSVLIRGHQYVPNRGYKINFGSCVTLFSASYRMHWPRSFVYIDDPGQVGEVEENVYTV